MNITPAIIVPAFSRPRSLRRLLDSLNSAQYVNNPTLVISIDGNAAPETIQIASDFRFHGGRKEIVTRSVNLGLREHLLWCGDQTERFGAAIVLEDDLVVDRQFFRFATASLEAYAVEPRLAGIALYAPRYNEFAGIPFEPCNSGTSTYFMQVPCSWGQAWTKAHWCEFRKWWASPRGQATETSTSIPTVVRDWPVSSWKKHFARYLADANRYIAYPYQSYSSNFSDPGGTHVPRGSTSHQVPMPLPTRGHDNFNFGAFDDAAVRYDTFMEPEASWLEEVLSLQRGSLVVDFFAQKDPDLIRSKTYCLTSRRTTQAIRRFPLARHPIELNVYDDAEEGLPFFSLCRSEHVILNSRPSIFSLHQFYHHAPLMSPVFAKAFGLECARRAVRALGRRVGR
jgi:hypothetical protein